MQSSFLPYVLVIDSGKVLEDGKIPRSFQTQTLTSVLMSLFFMETE